VLQEGEGDQHHERVVVQASPGSPLEVIEAEFFLHLLVRLLDSPIANDKNGPARWPGPLA
jgi:hypothetical protein